MTHDFILKELNQHKPVWIEVKNRSNLLGLDLGLITVLHSFEHSVWRTDQSERVTGYVGTIMAIFPHVWYRGKSYVLQKEAPKTDSFHIIKSSELGLHLDTLTQWGNKYLKTGKF